MHFWGLLYKFPWTTQGRQKWTTSLPLRWLISHSFPFLTYYLHLSIIYSINSFSLVIPEASPLRSAWHSWTIRAPPSVPQIINLLDWQDYLDHYFMVLDCPMPCMSMFNLVKLQRKLNEKMAGHVMWQVIHATNICCNCSIFHWDTV